MSGKRARFQAIDVVIILLCAAAGGFVYYRIQFGLEYNADWSKIPQYLLRRSQETGRLIPNYLLEGLATTLKLSIWSIVPAVIVGLILGIFRTSGPLFLRMIGRSYVELIRNLPPLVLVFIFYFFVADQIMPLLGVESFIRSRPESTKAVLAVLFAKESLFTQFLSGVLTLAFFEGAYMTEIFRSGIESIERGQREAAYSLGLSWFDQMRFVILPQAIKRVLPTLANEFINTIKYSSIASIVSIQELTFMGRQVVVATRQIFETWITVAVMYMVLTLTLSVFASRIETRLARSD